MTISAQQLMTERNEAIYDLGRWLASFAMLVGEDVLHELSAFARTAGEGSAITIRCIGEGFAAQHTGPIVGGRSRLLSSEDIAEFARELD